MKKILALGALVLAVGAGSLVAYADTSPSINTNNRNVNVSIEDRDTWFKERTEYKKEQIKKAVASGSITESEAKKWEEHFTYMENFHKENEFMPGGCGGNSFGMGNVRGNGFRNGMMRGNRF